jgi:hypothetical protein
MQLNNTSHDEYFILEGSEGSQHIDMKVKYDDLLIIISYMQGKLKQHDEENK